MPYVHPITRKIHDDPPPAPPTLPVRTQLFNLTKNYGAILSTGGQPFVCLPTGTNDGRYTVPLHSPHLQAFILQRHIAGTNTPLPPKPELRYVCQSITTGAYAGSMGGFPNPIYLRVGWTPDFDSPSITIALDTRRGRHISITQDHWIPSPEPTRTCFVYDPVQQELPDPIPTGDPEPAMRKFQNLLQLDDANFATLQSWLLTALRPAKDPGFHDYPILNLIGPESSGKTTAAKLITKLLDPTGTPLHTMPSTERRLHILASTHHLIAIDSPGKISPENARRLSRLASGIASTYRHFEGMLVRPVLLTTREPHETKHLSSRLVDVEFQPLETPLPQPELLKQFEAIQPEIHGALLTLLAQQFNDPKPCPPNRKEKNQKIEESVTALLNQQRGHWEGTVTQLVQATDLKISTKALGQYLKNEDPLSFEVQHHHKPRERRIILTASISSL